MYIIMIAKITVRLLDASQVFAAMKSKACFYDNNCDNGDTCAFLYFPAAKIEVRSKYYVGFMLAITEYNYFKPAAGVP